MKLLSSCADALASPRVAHEIVGNLTICFCLLKKSIFVTNILNIMLLLNLLLCIFIVLLVILCVIESNVTRK